MDANTIILIALGALNIPLYIVIGKIFWEDMDDFWDTVKFWFTPDFISLFRGEYFEDWWAEAKLGLFIVACIACVYGEFTAIQKLFMS